MVISKEHQDLKKLRTILASRLQATRDLRDAASVCRALVSSDLEGAGVFLLFALYFESLAARRESGPVDADKYEALVSGLLPLIEDCLTALENFDLINLVAAFDSFARTAVRLQFL